MMEQLMAEAIRNGASFDDASAFVDWAFDNFTSSELEQRSVRTLWSRWVSRHDSPATTDRSIVGADGNPIQRF